MIIFKRQLRHARVHVCIALTKGAHYRVFARLVVAAVVAIVMVVHVVRTLNVVVVVVVAHALSPCGAEPSCRARTEASSAEPFPSAAASSNETSPSAEKNPSAEAVAIGNDGQTAMLVMDTHNEGDDGQIAGARGNGSHARDGHVQQGQL